MSKKTIFISVAGILLLAFVMATVIYKNYQSTCRRIRGPESGCCRTAECAPVKGPVDARVTIVEFFDPACGTCADFYPLVKKLIDQYPGQVRVMMRYAPLHTGSDEVVKMLEAAHLQGKFFPALELLFSNQQRWVVNHVSQPMRAQGILNGMALDHEKLMTDMNQPEVSQAIQQDIQDGQALDVKATPEFFVNGKPLPSFGYEQLEPTGKRGSGRDLLNHAPGRISRDPGKVFMHIDHINISAPAELLLESQGLLLRCARSYRGFPAEAFEGMVTGCTRKENRSSTWWRAWRTTGMRSRGSLTTLRLQSSGAGRCAGKTG